MSGTKRKKQGREPSSPAQASLKKPRKGSSKKDKESEKAARSKASKVASVAEPAAGKRQDRELDDAFPPPGLDGLLPPGPGSYGHLSQRVLDPAAWADLSPEEQKRAYEALFQQVDGASKEKEGRKRKKEKGASSKKSRKSKKAGKKSRKASKKGSKKEPPVAPYVRKVILKRVHGFARLKGKWTAPTRKLWDEAAASIAQKEGYTGKKAAKKARKAYGRARSYLMKFRKFFKNLLTTVVERVGEAREGDNGDLDARAALEVDKKVSAAVKEMAQSLVNVLKGSEADLDPVAESIQHDPAFLKAYNIVWEPPEGDALEADLFASAKGSAAVPEPAAEEKKQQAESAASASGSSDESSSSDSSSSSSSSSSDDSDSDA